MPVSLTDHEMATVLAALRYWQQDLAENEDARPMIPDHFEEGISPLTVEEIDDLCEKLNVRAATKRTTDARR
jgi:hypothetical protein